MSVTAPSASRKMPTRERATSGLTCQFGPFRLNPPLLRRDLLVRRVVVRLRFATRQTSTTTGKIIGRRFVCS